MNKKFTARSKSRLFYDALFRESALLALKRGCRVPARPLYRQNLSMDSIELFGQDQEKGLAPDITQV